MREAGVTDAEEDSASSVRESAVRASPVERDIIDARTCSVI